MDSNDFDWDALAKQFKQEDALIKVVKSVGRAQATYYKTLTEEGFSPLEAMRVIVLTTSEIGKFSRETLPVLVQQFIDYNERRGE